MATDKDPARGWFSMTIFPTRPVLVKVPDIRRPGRYCVVVAQWEVNHWRLSSPYHGIATITAGSPLGPIGWLDLPEAAQEPQPWPTAADLDYLQFLCASLSIESREDLRAAIANTDQHSRSPLDPSRLSSDALYPQTAIQLDLVRSILKQAAVRTTKDLTELVGAAMLHRQGQQATINRPRLTQDDAGSDAALHARGV